MLDIGLSAISLMVLAVGFKWGVIAIHGGSVERERSPLLFWFIMTMAGALLLFGLISTISDLRTG